MTMKKTFRFLALSLMLLGGTLTSLAGTRPTDGPIDGASVGATVATTEGVQGVVTYVVNGWDATLDAYTVEITGLDYDGLQNPPKKLTIQTSFDEKWKTFKYKYYVNKIVDADQYNKAAFWAMTDLEELSFQATESVISEDKFTFTVGEYAFYGCTSMKKLTLPDNVTAIGKYAFQNTAITDFVIPAQCATIGEYAFNNSKSLKTVSVSEKKNTVLTTIKAKVFANSYVQTLDLSNATGLQGINDEAFIFDDSKVNNQLKTIILPAVETFTDLGATGVCFANLTGLTAITNLEKTGVTAINEGAFENDGKLPILNFPAHANIINFGGTSPFKACKSLATLTFADGWDGVIGDGATNIYESAGLTAAEQLKELSYLKTIEFKGKVYGTISAYAFGNELDEDDACSGLTTLTFTGALCEKATIGGSSFANCASLATLTFAKGIDATDADIATGDVVINNYAFAGTALTQVNFNGIKIGNPTLGAKNFTIAPYAFAASKLAEVAIGDITVNGGSSVAQIEGESFVSDLLTTFTVGNISALSGQVLLGSTSPIAIAEDLIEYPTGVLTTVTIGNIVAGNGSADAVLVKNYAFSSEVLESVTIGNITSAADADGKVRFGKYAFGCDVSTPKSLAKNAKSVTIGNISDGSDVSALTFTAHNYAFYGEKLSEVQIGNLAASTISILSEAFSGYELANVTIGDITGKIVKISDAFQNENIEDAMDLTVSMGKFNSDALTIEADAFVAPQAPGSTFAVTIGNIEKAPNIAAGAFVAPAIIGTTSYTLGDINAVPTTYAGTFTGSVDEEGVNSTSVTIGKYNQKFEDKSFKNVKDVTIAEWNVATNLSRFQGAIDVTISGDVLKNLGGATMNSVKSLTIGGNVKGAVIGGGSAFGKGVRSIMFTSDDPEVDINAFATGAFKAASDDAADDEQIVVVYRTKTAKKSNMIFTPESFGSDDSYKNVVLYTDEWSKDNTFKNIEIVGADHIFRMTLSAGAVAPGEDIKASCTVQQGGKYAYGRLFVPAGTGMYYKVSANKVDGKNTVNLFSAQNDGTNSDIYMVQLPIFEGYYWIDATETSQTFIVRTSNIDAAVDGKVTLEAEPATAEDIDMIDNDPDYYWFDKSDAKKNSLRYATSEVVNQELQNNDEFENKSIFVMANPKTNGLAFALLNQYTTTRNLAKGSIYVVASKLNPNTASARMNVIWDEDGELTGIKNIEAKDIQNDAIFTLQGVRVQNVKKGNIYIMNGKKYLAK